EEAEVRAAQAQLCSEPVHTGHDLAVALPGRTDDVLRAEAAGQVPRLLHRVQQAHRAQDIAQHVLAGVQPGQVRPIRHLDVDGDAAGQARGRLDRRVAGARKQLEVDVAVEALPPADDLHRCEHTLHRRVGRAGDARAEKEPVDLAGRVHLTKQTRQLYGLKRRAAAWGR